MYITPFLTAVLLKNGPGSGHYFVQHWSKTTKYCNHCNFGSDS